MTFAEKYPDLKLRLISGAVLILVGGTALYLGGSVFLIAFILLAGVMAWEVVALDEKQSSLNYVIAALMAGSVVLYDRVGLSAGLIGLLATIVAYQVALKPKDFILRAVVFASIFLGIVGLIKLRLEVGLIAIVWILLCVIASDVGGYFAGRTFGGPKLWPAVSPKKTWSGTVGGWVLAACVGMYFSQYYPASPSTFAFYGIVIAIFAQAGDLSESVLKRRAGVKDSSNLIPGHGGFLDRFDGVIGASLLVFLMFVFGASGVFLG